MENAENISVVADLYQLPRMNGKFSKEHKSLIRKGAKVLVSYIEDINADSQTNGKLWIVDQKATDERIEKQIENAAERQRKAKLSQVSATDLVAALLGNAAEKSAVESDPELEALCAEYKELSGKEAKKNWKASSVQAEIDKLKTT